MRALRIALTAGVAAALVAPGALAAPTETAVREDGPYHGGSLPETGPVLAYLLVSDDGEAVAATITLRAQCDAYPVPVQARVVVPRTALDEVGEATVERRITGDVAGPDGRPAREDGTSTVTLRVAADGSASGTVRLASVFTDAADGSEVARCDTGELGFRARMVPARAARGRIRLPRQVAELVGVAGVQPLVARVEPGGDLDGLALVYRSACRPRADGAGTRRAVFLPPFAVRRDGTFRVRGSQQLFSAGGEERVRIDLRGRYGARGTLLGTIRLRGRLVRDGEDEPAETCDTGRLRIRAIPAEVPDAG